MTNKITVFLTICILAACIGSTLTAPSITSKVNLALQKSLQDKYRVNIIISMGDGIDGTLAKVARSTFADRGARTQAVYDALNEQATISQKDVLTLLNSPKYFSTKIQSFWISNQIYVQGADATLIQALATMESISSIDEEIIINLEENIPVVVDPLLLEEHVNVEAEWGINIIRAEAAWATVGNGAGAVVGIIDTGARYTHESIRGNYRAGTHSWYNPYSFTQNPEDGNGHGTHCTGIMAGSGLIGVAPGAKWISCKGLQDSGSGSQSSLLSCGQFMLCPTTYIGQNPDCSLAPHVVSNSWAGGSGETWYDDVMKSWKASNIIPVFGNGNGGDSCSTSNSPADSGEGIAVGATTSTDTIASYSSRGPGPNSRQKPDVSAPGSGIRSAGHLSDTAYTVASGTSMATPHVAGLVGLLKSKSPNASYATIKSILESTTDRNLSFGSQVCNGRPENQFPNYTFGWGRINALSAVQALMKQMV